MHMLIQTWVQNGRMSLEKKQSDFAKKCSIWSFISEMKVTCMSTVHFKFWLFIVIAFFLSSLVVAFLCTLLL